MNQGRCFEGRVKDGFRIRLGIDVLESRGYLLQDGTAHLWEEGMHLAGVLVHLMDVFHFCLINGNLVFSRIHEMLIHVLCWNICSLDLHVGRVMNLRL